MKILFAGSRTWDDQPSVWNILDETAGNGPVHLVLGYDTRGAELYAAAWAKRRAKIRRTFVDALKAGRSYGPDRSEWRARRDEHMVSMGGYDVAVVLSRRARLPTNRPQEFARLAEKAGIPVVMHDYDETVPRKERSAQ